MRSLIIGGSGFVGGYLSQHLKKCGYEVAVTKMPFEQVKDTEMMVYELDILDKEAVSKIIDTIQPDLIFHLAAQSSVSVSWKNPELTIDVNIKGSMNVMEAVHRQEKRMRILLIGSGEEYGRLFPDEIPVSEKQCVRPGNIYAVTKACQNMLGSIYAQVYGLDVLMVRAFNHIGPQQAPLFVVSDFCRQIAEIEAGTRKAVIKTGNLNIKRDFTDVRDVVRAYVMLAEKGEAGETYNVGSGHAVSIGDILQIILEQSSAAIRIETDMKKLRPSDVPVIEADIHKMQKITGWEPQIPLEQTIRETLDNWRRRV